eukprot:COSAG01_NODE_1988_length_8706_cov_16.749506_15_plen_290_part_00
MWPVMDPAGPPCVNQCNIRCILDYMLNIKDLSSCAIHGDVAYPGVFLVQHKNGIIKGQNGPGYTVIYDNRFFDARDMRKQFAGHLHGLLDEHDYVVMPHAKYGEVYITKAGFVNAAQSADRLQNVQDAGQQSVTPSQTPAPSSTAKQSNSLPIPDELARPTAVSDISDLAERVVKGPVRSKVKPLAPRPAYTITKPEGLDALPKCSAEDLARVDRPLTGRFRSLGGSGKGYYVHGDEIRKWFEMDDSGVINDSPVMNWSPEEIEAYGLEIRLKPGCSAPPPLMSNTELE